MSVRRAPAFLTILSVLLVAVVFAVAGRASPADHQGAWSWQTAPGSAPKTLAAAQLGSERVALTAVPDPSGDVRLVLTSDGLQVQAISAASVTDAPLIPFVVTGPSGTASLVGVARGDVAHVVLFTGSNARELPLNGTNAFSTEIDGAPPLRLQALAADGAQIGATVIPPASATCGGSLTACGTPVRVVAGSDTLPRARAAALPRAAAASSLRVQRAAALAARSAHRTGTIRWLFNHELRGESLHAAGIRRGSTVGSHWQPVRFARVLTPDPESHARIVLSLIGKRGRNICISLYPDGAKATIDGAGGGCAVGLTLTPLSTITVYGPDGGYIAGAADDHVSRITLQFRNGSYANVPLHDNVFFIRIRPGTTPRALFSFNSGGRAIGHDTLRAVVLPLQTGSGAVSPRPRGTQSIRATQRYTVSNRGRLVPGRGNRLFAGRPYRIFLLGVVGGRAYYRVQLTQHYTCWGSGPSDKIGMLGISGCPTVVGAYPLQLDDNVVELKRGAKTPHSLRLAGIVADQATSVALRDANGRTATTVPVKDNLFAFSPPFPNGFVRAVPLDANGKPLLPHPEWGQHQTPPPNFLGPRAMKVSPSQLGTVVQRGEARGVTVSADQNGVVVFDARSINTAARRALGSRIAWFSCFQIDGQNVRHNRSAGISVPFAPEVAFKTVGIKPRYDGCEAGGSYGHRWHDQYGPHSTLEIPLTMQGGRYFEDRATARDLAAFVRSAKTQAIRRKTGGALLDAIHSAYGNQIAVLQSLSATAQQGEVGIWTHGTRTVFSERSHLGDRFYVEFDHGKMSHENVRGLAFVF